jgi:CDP-6-deoxy-D-xylo-4-hexulose-3-dehydrase
MPGYNLRPLELSAAAGIEQLKKLPGMTVARRRNMALFQELFAGDERFIIQQEHGKSSTFCFTIILNPKLNPDRNYIFAALEKADIGYRVITGGNFLRHDAIKFYDYDVVTPCVNADIAHDYGFFVGNHPFDLSPQITRLREVLDTAWNESMQRR